MDKHGESSFLQSPFNWMRRHVFCVAVLAVPAAQTALGQTVPGASAHPANHAAPLLLEEPDWPGVCSRALMMPLPPAAAALAHAAAGKSAPAAGQCDELKLYYGFGKIPDYRSALQCAYWHRAFPHAAADSWLQGAGTLAMLYANGLGTSRDYALAIRFACELKDRGVAQAEMELRIGRLEALRAGKLPDARFDLCDDQISGAMGGYCSDLSERRADAGRAQRMAALKVRLPEHAQAMLPMLQEAETAFERARIEGEYPGGGGSGSAGFALDDQNRLREQFLINLERFSAGKLPKASPANRQMAQKELDASYAAALAVPRDPKAPFGNPTTDGLMATEAAWQRLFEQWMQFTPIAYPGLSQDAVATELLRLRIHQVKKASY